MRHAAWVQACPRAADEDGRRARSGDRARAPALKVFYRRARSTPPARRFSSDSLAKSRWVVGRESGKRQGRLPRSRVRHMPAWHSRPIADSNCRRSGDSSIYGHWSATIMPIEEQTRNSGNRRFMRSSRPLAGEFLCLIAPGVGFGGSPGRDRRGRSRRDRQCGVSMNSASPRH